MTRQATLPNTRKRPWIVTVAAGGIAGLVCATAFITPRLLDPSPTVPADPQTNRSTEAAPDIVHNPPLLIDPGAEALLSFQLVCPGTPCATQHAQLEVTDASGEVHDLSLSTKNGVDYAATVPASTTDLGAWTYRARFAGDIEYPARGTAAMAATPVAAAQVVDLGAPSFSSKHQAAGDLVLEGPWGTGEREFGIDDVGSGPSGFGVGQDGTIVILDRANNRLVIQGPDGKRSTEPIDLPTGEYDLMVEQDGTIDLLNSNGGDGNAFVLRRTPEAAEFERIHTATGPAWNLRAHGNRVEVLTFDDLWVPVVAGGKVLTSDEQIAQATVGIVDSGATTYRKHLGETANETRVAQVRDDGSTLTWRIVGSGQLGPIDPISIDAAGVTVVQSEFSDQASQFRVIRLSADGRSDNFAVPYANYAEMSAAADFQFQAEHLYQARRTPDGFAIYRYSIEGPR